MVIEVGQEPVVDNVMLKQIRAADESLTKRYKHVLTVNWELDRTLVSFQANKAEAGDRWFKYKEGFSSALMHYLLDQVGIKEGHLLDPFAGSGTALFAASDYSFRATGIELLPSSTEAIVVRYLLHTTDRRQMACAILDFRNSCVWETAGEVEPFPHIKITLGAFPQETEQLLGRYLYEVNRLKNLELSRVLRFAALCILEAISYTRKDGQYLRWDYRSGRHAGVKPFDKGQILGFTEAIVAKLTEIATDLDAVQLELNLGIQLSNISSYRTQQGRIELLTGSCHEILPTLPDRYYDILITSPPYCNRYDYTRTYALELAMMGVGEEGIRRLRQTLLSCTVENKAKSDLIKLYPASTYERMQEAFHSQEVLQLVLSYLDTCCLDHTINNTGIPRMVRNYFWEMALVIGECARILKPGAPLIMVNDNVRYMGAHIPVDLILSDFAVKAGFEVERIWVLPRGKGNSSQQMGTHGREEMRKCVYVWKRI